MELLRGPFTTDAKLASIQKEVKASYETYFAKAAINRMWFPDRLPQRSEMAGYGHLISDQTKEILLGFMGVESVVDDYVFNGIQAAGDSISTRGLYIQWGFEERRHGQTFRHCLIDSGLYSQAYVDRFIAETKEYHWTFKDQTGYEATPLLGAAYAIFQERQTRWNYTATRLAIWEEYGSPVDERGVRIFPAVAGALRFPEIDEGAHEANFTNIVRIYMKYFLGHALEALSQVSSHYKMPIIQLPNADEFVRCVLAAGLGSPRTVINEVMNPALHRMGLEDRNALRKAVRNFRNLPENALVHLQGKDLEGIVPDPDTSVYTMMPSGDFTLDNDERGL